jgi:hypothetical protein
MMNDRLFLTEDPNTQLAIELARLRERVAALEAIEQPIRDTGLWTPSFTGTTSNGTITYTIQAGKWTRQGDIVFVVGRILTSAISVAPAGTLGIAGLPFPAVATTNNIAGVASMAIWSANITNGYTQVEGQILDTTSDIRLTRSGDNVTPATLTGSELIAGEWRFNGFYWVA